MGLEPFEFHVPEFSTFLIPSNVRYLLLYQDDKNWETGVLRPGLVGSRNYEWVRQDGVTRNHEDTVGRSEWIEEAQLG